MNDGCRKFAPRLEEWIDGRLAPPDAEAVRAHVEGCAACADTVAAVRAAGSLLRAWAAERSAEKAPQLDLLGTRVRAAIVEREADAAASRRWLRWIWLPAAAVLAVSALLFYPSLVGRDPIRPGNFQVAVESLESDTSSVALLDRGENLPKVIWISDDEEKT